MDLLTSLLAILLIVAFPTGNLIGFGFLKSANIILLDIFTLFLFLSWFLFRKGKIKHQLLLPISIFVVVLFFSFMVNIYWVPIHMLGSSFLYIIRWLLYLSVFFVLINSSQKIIKFVPYFMSGGGLAVVIIGYLQYIFYPSLQSLYQYGWDEHLYRLFAGFLDPNFSGIILSLVFLLNFQFLDKLKRSEYKYLFIFVQFLTFLAVLLTYSRTGLITFISSFLVFLILKGKPKFAMILVTLCVISILFLPKTFKTEGTNFLRTSSIQSRIQSIKDGFLIYSKNPVFGVGFNNLRYAQYKSGIISGSNWEKTHAGGGTDNSFLFVAVTTGIIGLGAYIFLLHSIFKQLFKNGKDNLTVITISSLAGVIVGSFFINGLFYPFIMLWLWSLLGVTLQTKP